MSTLSPVLRERNTSRSSTLVTLEAERFTSSGSSKKRSPPSARAERIKKRGKRTPPPVQKGLRHFSRLVCARVQEKGTTSYQAVADDIVAQYDSKEPREEKNVRRRVYDALNVLDAVGILSKDAKNVSWVGNVSLAFEREMSQNDASARREVLEQKKAKLQELTNQLTLYRALIARNTLLDGHQYSPEKLRLPFLVVNADKDTRIDMRMTPDRSECLFDFSDSFQISDDAEVLTRMNVTEQLELLRKQQQQQKLAALEEPRPYLPLC